MLFFFNKKKDAAAGGGAARGGGARQGAVDALTRKTGMTIDEACQILNVTKEAELEKILKVLWLFHEIKGEEERL